MKKKYRLSFSKIGNRIKENRLKKGLSREKLAEKANLSVSLINHVERAESTISLPSLIQIANALEISIDTLLIDELLSKKSIYLTQIIDSLNDLDADQLVCISKIIKANLDLLSQYKNKEK